MEAKNYTGLIPEQKEGRDITAEARCDFQKVERAKEFYKEAKKRLLFIHSWHKIAGRLSADFQLTDDAGKEVDRPAQKGDHFRIDITGPGSVAGQGYDWAKVEDIKEVNTGLVDSIAILVRPAQIRKHRIRMLRISLQISQPAPSLLHERVR